MSSAHAYAGVHPHAYAPALHAHMHLHPEGEGEGEGEGDKPPNSRSIGLLHLAGKCPPAPLPLTRNVHQHAMWEKK